MSETNGGTPPEVAGPYEWAITGKIADAADLREAITRVATALRSGGAFGIDIIDRSAPTPGRARYNVKPVPETDAAENARLRTLCRTLCEVAGADVLQVKPEHAKLLPGIFATFVQIRRILDGRPDIVIAR